MRGLHLVGALVLVVGLAGCGSEKQPTMPDVTGQKLDVAFSDIKRAGIEDEVEVLGGGMFGVVDKSNWEVCKQKPAAGKEVSDAPRVTVERDCGGGKPEPSETPSEEPNEKEAAESESPADAYIYEGPKFEVIVVDEDVTNADLKQHWVLTSKLDYSSEAYKGQIKLIIADIARKEQTNKMFVQVVTDREIAEAEAFSTQEAFVEEHGDDYFLKTIPQKEKTHWIASYTGGFDADAAEASDASSTFEVIWMIGSDNPEFEKWKPELAG